MVQNLWNPLSPMHYGGTVNLSKDVQVIYYFMNKTFRQGKIRPWSKVVPCTLVVGGCRGIEGLNLPVMPR
jgi:hypothetical protein